MSRLTRYLQLLALLIPASLFFLYFLTIDRYPPNDNVNDGRRMAVLIDDNEPETRSETTPSIDNWRNLTQDQIGKLSVLGQWLIAPEGTDPPKPRVDREFLILIWKYGPMLERRHIKRFTSETFSPWENCSVKNCRLSYNEGDVEEADAVIFHLHKTKGVEELPKEVKLGSRMKQRWIFLTDESPRNTFLGGKQTLASYNGVFNWSMTYRMDSDVPVPYGRTILRDKRGKNGAGNPGKKGKLVAVMGSNCGGNNRRWDYVKKLEDSLKDKLDIYGHCLGGDTKSCPGHFANDCGPLEDYKFYLSFENSNCREYMTEKVFWNAYAKKAVPIIMGAPRDDCRKYLPPRSYIHTDDFANPNTLADYLIYLDKTDEEYSQFHHWRRDFKVVNEHGYFKSVSRHYCRVCEALNYNDDSPKVYNDLEKFWNPNIDCS